MKELMDATRESQMQSMPNVKNDVDDNRKYMKDSGEAGMKVYSNTGTKQNSVG